MADLLLNKLEGKSICWGSGDLTEISELRKQYISALQCADKSDYSKLIEFVNKQNSI